MCVLMWEILQIRLCSYNPCRQDKNILFAPFCLRLSHENLLYSRFVKVANFPEITALHTIGILSWGATWDAFNIAA